MLLTPAAPPWVTLAGGPVERTETPPVQTSRVLLQLGLVALLVMGLVGVLGVVVARRVAEREAISGATQATGLLAEAVVQPALDDALLSGTPDEALARLDAVVRTQILGPSIVRVKLRAPDGLVVYADEPALIGQTFLLDAEETAALTDRAVRAEVADLDEPENVSERGLGELLEVFRPVWTPAGQPLLLETYTAYPPIAERTGQLWRGFAGIMVASQLLLVSLLLPLVWALLDRVRKSQRHREGLLRHAVDASAEERRRIAGALHDGVVQELVATSYAVSAGAERADALNQPELAARLRAAATTVRAGIGGLRSLLVDIYPPNLRTAGLVAALTDLAGSMRTRDIEVRLDLPDAATPIRLDADGEQLVFRVAQECLRNAARHAVATRVELRVFAEETRVVLEVADNGVGFDVAVVRESGPHGHFGVRVLPDLASQAGATLRLATAVGRGTRWRLEVDAP